MPGDPLLFPRVRPLIGAGDVQLDRAGLVRSNPASEAQWQAFGAEGQGRVLEATFMRRLGTPEVRLQSSPDLPDFAPSHPNLLPYPGHR